MSQIFVSGFIIVLAQLVDFFGLPFTSDQVSTIASFLVSLGAAIWIMYRRHQVGDINAAGVKK
jgi:hypothetical protein